jgi:hypothetical protein
VKLLIFAVVCLERNHSREFVECSEYLPNDHPHSVDFTHSTGLGLGVQESVLKDQISLAGESQRGTLSSGRIFFRRGFVIAPSHLELHS